MNKMIQVMAVDGISENATEI